MLRTFLFVTGFLGEYWAHFTVAIGVMLLATRHYWLASVPLLIGGGFFLVLLFSPLLIRWADRGTWRD